MADLAHDQRAHVDAYAQHQRPADLAHDVLVQPVEPEVDIARGAQCLAAAGGLSVAAAEDRHQTVAQVFVDGAVVALDRFAHLGEQAVEDEHDVVGQTTSRRSW